MHKGLLKPVSAQELEGAVQRAGQAKVLVNHGHTLPQSPGALLAGLGRGRARQWLAAAEMIMGFGPPPLHHLT